MESKPEQLIGLVFDVARAAGVSPKKLIETIKDKKAGIQYAEDMAKGMLELLKSKIGKKE